MKSYFISFIACVLWTITVKAQTIDTRAFEPASDSLKGKLLLMTECHEVRSNFPLYISLIDKLTKDFTIEDTLNIFLEAPFTLTHFINEYLNGKNSILTDSVLANDSDKIEFYSALKNMKRNIRFIGADFEYDQGNEGGRLEAYKMYFDQLKESFVKAGVDVSVLRSFIYGIRIQGLEEADFYTFKKYIQKLMINQPDAAFKSRLKEANFVLSALQSYDKTDVRDKAYYSRVLELIHSGYSVAGNYNLTIFGSAHCNPYNEKCLYSKFAYASDSPFLNKVKIFANIYIECLSYGSYNAKSIVLETVGLYYGSKEDKLIVDQVKNEFRPESENNVFIHRNTLQTNLKDADKVLYWNIHYKVK